jgi:hypothetical protein
MPRFSIKDLMLAITMVSVGLAMILTGQRCRDNDYLGALSPAAPTIAILLLWEFGGMTLGAGIFYPFKRVDIGLRLGAIAGVVLVCLGLMDIV